MSQNLLNTTAIQQFINQVRSAELGKQREIKLEITTAQALAHTLALAMTRLAGNYEGLLQKQTGSKEEISIKMDGGGW